jgi:hypothetical protein
MKNEGITREIMNGLICYLLSHKRPIHEVLSPKFKDQKKILEAEFAGMTTTPFTYVDFEKTRSELVSTIHGKLSQNDKQFLTSFTTGSPKWDLFPESRIQTLPAVAWKLGNIRKMKEEKRTQAQSELEKSFENRKPAT